MDIHFHHAQVISSMKKLTVSTMFIFFVFTGFFHCLANASYTGSTSFNHVHNINRNFSFRHGYAKYPYHILDHAIPDKCSDSRKKAYKFTMATIVSCAAAAACAMNSPICWLFVPGTAAVCAAMAVTMSVYLGKYDGCCKGLTDQPERGWTKSMLQGAAKCDSCMSKEDVLKDTCNM